MKVLSQPRQAHHFGVIKATCRPFLFQRAVMQWRPPERLIFSVQVSPYAYLPR